MIRKANKSLKQKAENFLDSKTTTATATKIFLAVIAVGGLVVAGALIPNVVRLLGKRWDKNYSANQLRRAYYNLKSRGLVAIKTDKQGKSYVCLTKKGEQKLDDLDLDSLTISKPEKWDSKWRVLIFDLPIRFNKAREALRFKIKNLGFYQLQKSVWLYPYPCEEELVFLAEYFGVTKFLEVLTVEKILRESKLKNHFNLA